MAPVECLTVGLHGDLTFRRHLPPTHVAEQGPALGQSASSADQGGNHPDPSFKGPVGGVGDSGSAAAASATPWRGPTVSLRSWATVWSADLSRPLLTVGLGDPAVAPEALAALRNSCRGGADRSRPEAADSSFKESSVVVLIPRALSVDGSLALRIEADLSYTGRLLLRATVEAVAACAAPSDHRRSLKCGELGSCRNLNGCIDCGIGGVTLLDADVLWSMDADSGDDNHAGNGDRDSANLEVGCGAGRGKQQELLIGGRTTAAQQLLKRGGIAPAVVEPPAVDYLALVVDRGLRPFAGKVGEAAHTAATAASGLVSVATAPLAATPAGATGLGVAVALWAGRRRWHHLRKSAAAAREAGACVAMGPSAEPINIGSGAHLAVEPSEVPCDVSAGRRSSVKGSARMSHPTAPRSRVARAVLAVGVLLVALLAVAQSLQPLDFSASIWGSYWSAWVHPEASHGRRFFVHGWQSWSFTGTLTGTAQVPPYRLGALLNDGFHRGGRAPPIALDDHHGDEALAFPPTSIWERVLLRTTGKKVGREGIGFRVSHWFAVAASPIFNSDKRHDGCKNKGTGVGLEGVVVGFVSQRRTLGTVASDPAMRRLVAFADTDGVALTALPLAKNHRASDAPGDVLNSDASDDASDAASDADHGMSGDGSVNRFNWANGMNGGEQRRYRLRSSVTTDWLSIEIHPLMKNDGEPMAAFLDFSSDAHGLPFRHGSHADFSSSRDRKQKNDGGDGLPSRQIHVDDGTRNRLLAGFEGLVDHHDTSPGDGILAEECAPSQAQDPGGGGDDDDGLEPAQELKYALPLLDSRGPLSGWCSWYHFYEHVSEDAVRANVNDLASVPAVSAAAARQTTPAYEHWGERHDPSALPLELVQVDDGFQTAWGDWSSLKPGTPEPREALSLAVTGALGRAVGRVAALLLQHREESADSARSDSIVYDVVSVPARSLARVRHVHLTKGGAPVLMAVPLDPALLSGGFRDMSALAEDLKAASFVPGVWLAPGAMDKHSKIAAAHSEWILRDYSGTPINAGFCGKFYYALDVTHPEALAHVSATITTAVHVWGFSYLKLDFLHSSFVQPAKRYDPSLTRAEAFGRFMATIRRAAGPGVFILGCGLPLGPGLGHVHAARVSADAGPQWLPTLNDKHNIPGARNMVRNAITRLSLHRRAFLSDPDCLLLRDTTSLSLDEVRTVATVVGLLGGPTIISDDLPNLSDQRRRIGASLLPIAASGPRAVAIDLLDREEPSLLMRPFHPEASAFSVGLGATPGYPQRRRAERSDGRDGRAFRTSTFGTWRAVAVLNWHWRPSALAARVHLPTEGAAAHEAENDVVLFHCFEFWTETYQRLAGRLIAESWRENDDSLSSWAEVEVGLPLVDHSPSAALKKRAATEPPSSMQKNDGVFRGSVKEQLIPSHGVALFLLRAVNTRRPAFVGSDVHFSCGLEVASWDHNIILGDKNEEPLPGSTVPVQRLEIFLYVGRAVPRGHVWLYLPAAAGAAGAQACSIVHDTGNTPADEVCSANGLENCTTPPQVAGSAFAGSIERVHSSDVGGCEISGDVWKVGVSFAAGGGALVVKW